MKKKETKDYALSVSLDHELTFALRDYVNGLEYKRTYTEDDYYNKQINRKVELSDIYLSFADN